MVELKDLPRDDAIERIREAIDSFKIEPMELYDEDYIRDSLPLPVGWRN